MSEESEEKKALDSEASPEESGEALPQEDGPQEKPKAAPLEELKGDLNTVVEMSTKGIASGLGGLPPVDPEAMNANAGKTGKPSGFDPALHETDERGNPIPLKSGKGWRKKRGRKKVNEPEGIKKEKPSSEEERQALARNAEAFEARIKSDAAILGHANGMLIQTVFDIEMTDAEKQNLGQSYEPLVRQYGGVSVPPWALPIFVSVGIVAAHAREEKPKTRLQKLRELSKKTFRKGFLWLKDRRAARK